MSVDTRAETIRRLAEWANGYDGDVSLEPVRLWVREILAERDLWQERYRAVFRDSGIIDGALAARDAAVAQLAAATQAMTEIADGPRDTVVQGEDGHPVILVNSDSTGYAGCRDIARAWLAAAETGEEGRDDG